jgi:hypothetical protein
MTEKIIEDFMIPLEYDRVMETRKRYEKIPFIRFPADWDIKIVPPFS